MRNLFEEYLNMLVEFSGEESEIDLPDDPQRTSFMIGDMLQVAERVKQRLLEVLDTKSRLQAELDFLERLLPQLRRLLERRRTELQVPPRTRRRPILPRPPGEILRQVLLRELSL